MAAQPPPTKLKRVITFLCILSHSLALSVDLAILIGSWSGAYLAKVAIVLTVLSVCEIGTIIVYRGLRKQLADVLQPRFTNATELPSSPTFAPTTPPFSIINSNGNVNKTAAEVVATVATRAATVSTNPSNPTGGVDAIRATLRRISALSIAGGVAIIVFIFILLFLLFFGGERKQPLFSLLVASALWLASSVAVGGASWSPPRRHTGTTTTVASKPLNINNNKRSPNNDRVFIQPSPSPPVMIDVRHQEAPLLSYRPTIDMTKDGNGRDRGVGTIHYNDGNNMTKPESQPLLRMELTSPTMVNHQQNDVLLASSAIHSSGRISTDDNGMTATMNDVNANGLTSSSKSRRDAWINNGITTTTDNDAS
jgi:hypothetical protein